MVGSLIMPDYRFTTSHLLTSILINVKVAPFNQQCGRICYNKRKYNYYYSETSFSCYSAYSSATRQFANASWHVPFRLRFFLSFLVIQRFNKGAILEAHCSANGRGKWLKWKCNVPLGRNASPLLQYDNVIIVQLLSDIETSFLKIHLHSRIYFFIFHFIFFFIPSSFMLK